MEIFDIVAHVAQYDLPLVCITGGEPLKNRETPALIQELLSRSHTVLVETNGSYDISILPASTIKIMDIKCPASDMHNRMYWQNIRHLTKRDEVKFVVSSREDYEWAKEVMREFHLSDITNVIMGVAYGIISSKSVVKWILEDNLSVRFQLQMHKYIWGPNLRGV